MIRLVVVGSVALDSVETPFGKVEEALGGSAVFFSLSGSYFTKVGLVGVVGNDYPKSGVDLLRTRNVDLDGLTHSDGETFRWVGEYGYDLNTANTLDTQLNVFAEFTPDLPTAYRNAPFVFLANIDPELQVKVLDQIEAPRFVAADTMNFWIQGKRDALIAVLERVDAILINDAEARELTGEWNIVGAIRKIHELGPKVVVVKRGEYGALLSTPSGFFFSPAFPLESVKDPTGAGDSFAGGFMGYLARREVVDEAALRQAVIFGSVMASLCVEDFSTRSVGGLQLEQIRERARRFRTLVDPYPIESLL